ncbi:MAG: hypothetical protein ACTSU5_16440 [Promethearchaeota archaeon]
MSSFLTDSLQSIYQRISGLGKSIQDLSETLERINTNINDKVSKLTHEISGLTEELKKEGKLHLQNLENIGQTITREILKVEEGIGLEAILELKESLRAIHDATKDALKPENVDILLAEALESIKILSGEKMVKAAEGDGSGGGENGSGQEGPAPQ